MLDAMRVGRGTFAMKYAYFSNLTTPLMDKLVLFHGHHMDLGGMSVGSLLRDVQTVAMHTTCYEKSTKVSQAFAFYLNNNNNYSKSQRSVGCNMFSYVLF